MLLFEDNYSANCVTMCVTYLITIALIRSCRRRFSRLQINIWKLVNSNSCFGHRRTTCFCSLIAFSLLSIPVFYMTIILSSERLHCNLLMLIWEWISQFKCMGLDKGVEFLYKFNVINKSLRSLAATYLHVFLRKVYPER